MPAEITVVAYFADDPTRTYQLGQWLPVLEILNERHPVGIVARDPDSARLLSCQTSLPVFTAPSLTELTALYEELDANVVLYCNNSVLNFQSLISSRMLHVHMNHGESDKQSMASNNAKAYDRVLVAGTAAVQRHTTGLLEFDTNRLERIGRPQLDLRPASMLAPSTRRTVLYAPTWEGDAEYNDYTSVDTVGRDIVRAILAVPEVRIIYKPHPKVATSPTPRIRDAHHDILRLVINADLHDPAAGHLSITVGDILAVIPDCDAMITDVSSVGLDWLYLRTDKPLFLTDRRHDAERLRLEIPVSRCADVIDDVEVEKLTALISATLENDEHHLARVAMRHHYFDDLQVGDSTVRFLNAVSDLIALRDQLVGTGSASAHESTANTA